jgi:Helix-turn-helix domain
VIERLAQVRGVLAERVLVSTEMDPFFSLRGLASYSGLSVRTLRGHLTDSRRPLPFYRIGVKILVRRSDFDAWIGQYRQVGPPDVDRIVAEVFTSTRGR